MKEHPILFSGPMVKAILEGRKTQTRRVILPQPESRHHRIDFEHGFLKESIRICGCWEVIKKTKCKYESGDLLWVRETFWHDGSPLTAPHYHADGKPDISERHDAGLLKKKPSIHMPKKFCRIWLKVKGVRVERLQDISEEDAVAEGVLGDETEFDQATPRMCFELLWNSINSARGYGWKENPWVWVLEFEWIER